MSLIKSCIVPERVVIKAKNQIKAEIINETPQPV